MREFCFGVTAVGVVGARAVEEVGGKCDDFVASGVVKFVDVAGEDGVECGATEG